jgi:hypothetical protein
MAWKLSGLPLRKDDAADRHPDIFPEGLASHAPRYGRFYSFPTRPDW